MIIFSEHIVYMGAVRKIQVTCKDISEVTTIALIRSSVPTHWPVISLWIGMEGEINM
jgi:hypothetical protein